ncbi:MAG TPA: ABC transporter ATP-binding protein [Ruminococcus sp.]|nr:ABC transporter ATP-binding protein [Ruminococcus sp.]
MNQNSLKWLWTVTGSKKWNVFFLMLVQSLSGLSGVIYALLLRNIVDNATDGNREGFWKYAILTAILVLMQVALSATNRFLQEYSKSGLENLFKHRLLSNILSRDFGSVNAVHSGEWMNRLTNDCMIVANNVTEIIPNVLGMVIKLVSAGVMLVVLDARFAGVLIPAGFVLLFFATAFRKKIKILHKKIQEKDGKLRIYLQERIGSLMMLRSFAVEEQTISKADDRMSEHQKARMEKNHFSNFCNIGFQSGMQGMYLVGVCYCGYGILTGRISYGTLTAITQLISQIQSPFANISGYLPKFYAMVASAERLMDIEQFENDMQGEIKPIQEIRGFYEHDFSAMGLKDVTFTYYPVSETVHMQKKTDMPIVLQNLSLFVHKGEYIAFTGHSGCGKSTILKLLMCIYKPDSGERFISDSSGNSQPLTPEWHKLFAYVPQGNQLMSGTIREIIAFANPQDSQNIEKIQYALKVACADEFVNELENGIDTLLGERGTGLSEGQMQRIAVARAIFSESPVLLLDEATSALDEKTEKKMLENLKNMTEKTVIAVTHRPAALDICDRILIITENGITEKGA